MSLSSTKHSFPTFFFFFFLLFSLQHTTAAPPPTAKFAKSACLRVSPSKFVNSATEVITIIEQLTSVLSRFTKIFGNSHLSHAISDCLDLLDISSDVLTWSVSATQNPQGKDNSTGNLSSDLRTWLSAVMVNPETCMEGLEGTNSIVKRLISSGLGKVITMVTNLLVQVVPPISDEITTAATTAGEGEYLSWVNEKDMKLQVNGVNADAVVAADGSGNYTTVQDAVDAAPDYSMKRYVIYVKRGVYLENVEIKKKKWNIMMVGEGMDSTVISGNWNFVDGWTTFRTATFDGMAPKNAFQILQARAAVKAGVGRGSGPVSSPIQTHVNLDAQPINTVTASEADDRPLFRKPSRKRNLPPLGDKGKKVVTTSSQGAKKSRTKKTAPFNCEEFMNTKAEDFKVDPFRTSLAVFTRMTNLVDDMRSDANKQIADAKKEAEEARNALEKVKADLSTSENEKATLKKEADQKLQELKDQLTSAEEKATKHVEDLERLKKELAELKGTGTPMQTSELQEKIA